MAFQIPLVCPVCDQTTVKDGVQIFCVNVNCKGQILARLGAAVSKPALDWNGCGAAQVKILVEDLGCKKLSDLFALTDEQLKPHFGPKQRSTFLSERERAKTTFMWRKYAALGIDLIGQTASKELAAKYGSIKAVYEAGLAQLSAEFGPVAAGNLMTFISTEIDELTRLAEFGFTFDQEITAKPTGPLTGFVVCLTGAMTSGSRPQVQAMIEKHGGLCKGSVSKDVTHLVSGEAAGAGKAKQAAKYGTKVITEEELYRMAGVTLVAVTGETQEW